MIESLKEISINNWLNTKLDNRDSGIIFAELPSDYFTIVQDFLAAKDCPRETHAIYYEAFPEESAAEFFETLCQELIAKFGSTKFDNFSNLPEIIATVGLEMVIIDNSYLHPLDTLEQIVKQLISCKVAVILIGSRSKMKIAKVFDLAVVKYWDILNLDGICENLT